MCNEHICIYFCIMEKFLPYFTDLKTIDICSFVIYITYEMVFFYHKNYLPFCKLIYYSIFFSLRVGSGTYN